MSVELIGRRPFTLQDPVDFVLERLTSATETDMLLCLSGALSMVVVLRFDFLESGLDYRRFLLAECNGYKWVVVSAHMGNFREGYPLISAIRVVSQHPACSTR